MITDKEFLEILREDFELGHTVEPYGLIFSEKQCKIMQEKIEELLKEEYKLIYNKAEMCLDDIAVDGADRLWRFDIRGLHPVERGTSPVWPLRLLRRSSNITAEMLENAKKGDKQ